MFFHNFKYSFKVLLKNKALIFWTVMWPIILGTMFYVAFSNISDSEKLKTIDIGVVDNDAYKEDNTLKTTLEELSNKKSDSYLFDIKYADEEELTNLLNDKQISGYIIKDKDTKIVIKENGINQTIIKYVVDQIYEYDNLATNIIKQNMEQTMQNGKNINLQEIYNSVINDLNSTKTYMTDKSKVKSDYAVIEYYTLIAMAALFGAMLTSNVVSNYLANINKKGARVTLAPVNRLTILLGGLLASFIVQACAIALLLIYTGIILKIDYGNRLDLVILLSLVGSLTGNSLGLLTGSMTFKNENSRVGVVMAVAMLGCFLSGMMGISMKYIIDKNIPIINKINPASMITDGFYSLYYYDKLDRYWFDIGSLLVVSVILLIISFILMRRKRYDSI